MHWNCVKRWSLFNDNWANCRRIPADVTHGYVQAVIVELDVCYVDVHAVPWEIIYN